jgi:hypothetical protein
MLMPLLALALPTTQESGNNQLEARQGKIEVSYLQANLGGEYMLTVL